MKPTVKPTGSTATALWTNATVRPRNAPTRSAKCAATASHAAGSARSTATCSVPGAPPERDRSTTRARSGGTVAASAVAAGAVARVAEGPRQGHGKIERFFGTLTGELLSGLPGHVPPRHPRQAGHPPRLRLAELDAAPHGIGVPASPAR